MGTRRTSLVAVALTIVVAWLLLDDSREGAAVVNADSDVSALPEQDADVRELAKTASRTRTPIESLNPVEASESDSLDEIEFVVRDEYGKLIDEAVVHYDDPDGFVQVGRTSSDGRLTASMPDKAVTWSVSKDGFVTTRLRRELPGTEEVVLESAPTIHGVITRSDGVTVCPGVNVVVFEPFQRPKLHTLSVAASLYPKVATATSDESGRFEIRGLAPGSNYRIEGGGNGYVFSERRIARECFDGEPLEIKATRLFGIRVLFRDVDGSKPKYDGSLFLPRGSSFDIFQLGPSVYPTSFAAVLAGVNPDRVAHEFQTLISADTHLNVLGPFAFTVHSPGYQSVSSDSYIYPVVDAVTEQVITQTPIVSRWGKLKIVDPNSSDERTYPNGRTATLEFRDQASNTVSFQYQLRQWPSESIVVDGIPYGDYFLRLQSSQTSWRYPKSLPGTPVTIGPEDSQFVIDSQQLGSIRLQILDSNGEPYDRYCLVQIAPTPSPGSGERSSTSWANLERAPYLLPWVKPGTYELILEQPFGGIRRESVSIEVISGETSEVTLRL